MGDIIKQHMYLPPSQPEHMHLHIDCALYVYFITLQIVSKGQVGRLLTPEGIHYARPILALHLVKNWSLPDIRYWLLSHDALVPNSQDIHPLSPAKSMDAIPIAGGLVTTCRSRPQLQRRAKTANLEEEMPPMPSGRKIHSLGVQTYIAYSTMSDNARGIDADHGLFASRTFRSDTTRIDDDLVAYYVGTPLSMSEVEIAKTRPDLSRPIGFILVFEGLGIDGWDHVRNTHAGPGAAVNDFLGERNNCYIEKELINEEYDDDGVTRTK